MRVRVVGRTDEWNGRTGVLQRPPIDGVEDRRWSVRMDDHGLAWFFPDQLEIVPAEPKSAAPRIPADGTDEDGQ